MYERRNGVGTIEAVGYLRLQAAAFPGLCNQVAGHPLVLQHMASPRL